MGFLCFFGFSVASAMPGKARPGRLGLAESPRHWATSGQLTYGTFNIYGIRMYASDIDVLHIYIFSSTQGLSSQRAQSNSVGEVC